MESFYVLYKKIQEAKAKLDPEGHPLYEPTSMRRKAKLVAPETHPLWIPKTHREPAPTTSIIPGVDELGRIVDPEAYKTYQIQQQRQPTQEPTDPNITLRKASSDLSKWLDLHPQYPKMGKEAVMSHPKIKKFLTTYSGEIQRKLERDIENKVKYYRAIG